MKKNLIKIVLTTVLAGVPLFANDTSKNTDGSTYDLFIGVEQGLSSIEFTDVSGGYENNGINTYGFKIGAVNDTTRMYLAYHDMDAFEDNTDKTGSFWQATMNLEALSKPYYLIDAIGHSFFVGGHLGGLNLDVKSAIADSSEFGAVYGVQGGILNEFSFGMNIEFGYRYSWSSFSEKNTKVSNQEHYYVGLNYRF